MQVCRIQPEIESGLAGGGKREEKMSCDIQPSGEKGLRVTRVEGHGVFMEAGNAR